MSLLGYETRPPPCVWPCTGGHTMSGRSAAATCRHCCCCLCVPRVPPLILPLLLLLLLPPPPLTQHAAFACL